MLEKDKPKFDSMNTTKQSQTVLVKQKKQKNKKPLGKMICSRIFRQPVSPGLESNPSSREKSNCYRNHTSLQNCLRPSMDAFVTKKKIICQRQPTRGLGYNGRPFYHSAPSAESWHSYNFLSLFIFFFLVLEGKFESHQNLD